MEFDHNGMIYFALKEESGQVVHISEMVEKDRGKACECICLCCGRPLVAKLGRGKRTAHFAHLAEEGRTTCLADVANESGLHKIAKEIVCKSEYIWLPPVTISEQNDPNRNMEDYKQQEPLLLLLTTLIISKKPGNTGISRDIRTEFTTDLLLSD